MSLSRKAGSQGKVSAGMAVRASRLCGSVLRLLRHHRSGLFLLAVLVGLAAGAGAIVFRLGIESWSRLLTGADDYTEALGPSTGAMTGLRRYFVLLSPVLSGLLVGPLMALLGGTRTGHGVSGAIWSSRRSDGGMAPRPAVVSVASSALTIGGGGSVGPEGPIAELGAAASTVVGHSLRLPQRAMRLLAAAGTAAGIAAAFNAPLAGAFFAMEVILVDFTVDAFTFVVLACVSATVLSHHLGGTSVNLTLPPLWLARDAQLGWVALVGVLGGVVGVIFSRCRYLAADAAAWVGRHYHLPVWTWPALGGLPIGLFLLAVPEMYGESSAVLDRILEGRYPALVLVGLTLAKIIATSLTLGAGFSGGVFAPSLFIGGALGAALGTAVTPGHPEAVAVFGVIGMCAVFSGSAHAPMTAIILIIEMTSQYSLLVPLMLAAAVASVSARFLSRTTIYTEDLRRRGLTLTDPQAETSWGSRFQEHWRMRHQ